MSGGSFQYPAVWLPLVEESTSQLLFIMLLEILVVIFVPISILSTIINILFKIHIKSEMEMLYTIAKYYEQIENETNKESVSYDIKNG